MSLWRSIGAFVRRTAGAVRYILSLRWIRQIWMYSVRLVERMDDDHIFLSAGGIAFSTILCLIPVVLLVFYVLSIYLTTEAATRTINEYIDALQLFPIEREQLRTEVFSTLTEFVGVRSLAGIVGGLGLLWSASALFSSIRSVFNKIFRIRVTKNILMSKVKDFVMLSIVGVTFVVAAVFTYGLSAIRYAGEEYFGIGFEGSFLAGSLAYAGSLLVSFVAIYLLFRFVPDRRLPVKAIFLSVLIATLLWEFAKHAFGWYIGHFWSIGRIYGPYSFLVVIAIWIYYSSLTLIVAAEFGEMLIERSYMKRLFRPASLTRVAELIRGLHGGGEE